MDGFGAKLLRIFYTLVAFLMAGMILDVSANCDDPGTPVHGHRIIAREGGGFAVGTVISFSCSAHYTLIGAKKIICSAKGNWNGKVPYCKSQGCPLLPPTVVHANITTSPVLNSKGSYVNYACVHGYVPDPDRYSTRLLCDKDPVSQGYVWSGNFTCKKKTCGNPPLPITGHVYYNLSVEGSIIVATYFCYPSYILRSGVRITKTFVRSCGQSGYWSSTTTTSPTCVKTCKSTDIAPDHGRILSWTPRYFFADYVIRYTSGVTVTFTCDNRYRLEGSERRTCLASGLWSGIEPRCVLSHCGSPGSFANGQVTHNSTYQSDSSFPIWTVVFFSCHTGYQLQGVHVRQCLPSGQWTGQQNPKCLKSYITCQSPTHIIHGQYLPVKPTYALHVRVHYICNPGYYLWGDSALQCSIANQGSWISTKCYDSNSCDNVYPECLLPSKYEEKCQEKIGYHANIAAGKAFCSLGGTADTPSANLISIKSRGNELDKMTIVVATAGSTLGALVVLLTALVCFRRFHRSRRFRHSAFRSRRYSDDDRIAIIAAYTGDVHFILPSYDEAISQVESLPPPFESVVAGEQDRDNQPAANSNSPTADEDVSLMGQNSVAGTTDGAPEVSDPATSTHEVGPSLIENQPINIVSNPLADSSHSVSDTVEGSDHVFSAVNEGGVNLSQESLDAGDFDSSPNHPSECIPSSSSEDDLTSSQSQPLLGSNVRGVMV